MIKKMTAFCFILFANIVLLVHAVLPHHHHHLQVCIVRTHCIDDATTHEHNSHEQNHQHDGSDNTNCVLKQAVVLPSSQARFINNCYNCTDNHNHDFYILLNVGYKYQQPDYKVVTYTSVLSSFFTTYVTQTLGLRAPPIV